MNDWEHLRNAATLLGLSLPWLGGIGALAYYIWESEGRTAQLELGRKLRDELHSGAWYA
jgi:hypothetical protein